MSLENVVLFAGYGGFTYLVYLAHKIYTEKSFLQKTINDAQEKADYLSYNHEARELFGKADTKSYELFAEMVHKYKKSGGFQNEGQIRAAKQYLNLK